MTQNTLELDELKGLIQPFLRLAEDHSIIQTLSDMVGPTIRRGQTSVCQPEVVLTYRGYRVDITDLKPVGDVGLAVHLQFKAKQKWYHGLFKDQNEQLINDLQLVCKSEIHGLSFTRYETTQQGDPLMGDGPVSLVFFHDSRAFNRKWRQGRDISPLLLSPDAHHGNCFVEFYFNPAGYTRQKGQTVLRKDWERNVFLVSEAIGLAAERRLGRD